MGSTKYDTHSPTIQSSVVGECTVLESYQAVRSRNKEVDPTTTFSAVTFGNNDSETCSS